jgi:hypothetical protein
LNGQLLVLKKRWPDAIAIFDEIISGFTPREIPMWRWRICAERAYCLAKSNDFNIAAEEAWNIERNMPTPELTNDDLAATRARLSAVGSIVNDPDMYSRNLELASKHLAEYRSAQIEFLKILEAKFPE